MVAKKLLPIFLLSMALSACNGEGPVQSQQSQDSSNQPQSQSQDKSQGGGDQSQSQGGGEAGGIAKPTQTDITIDFWHTFGQGIEEGVKAEVDKFVDLVKKNDGVNLKINLSKEGSYTDIQSKIDQGFSAGNVPTLAVAYPDHVANYLGKHAKYVQNLDDYINDPNIGFGKEAYLGDKKGNEVYDKDDFIGVFMDEGTNYAVQGTYSLPFMKSTEVLFYNLDMVKKAMDIYKPEISRNESKIKEFIESMTWDQLMEISTIIKNNKATIAPSLEYPVFYDSDGNFFISQLYQRGIKYSSFDAQRNPQVDFEQTAEFNKVVTMIDELRQNHKDGLVTTKGTKGEYSSYSFTDELCAFAIGSSGGAGYNSPKSDSFTFGVAPVPYKGTAQYVTQGVTLTILRNPSYSDADNDARVYYAWKFAKYITNPEVNAVLCVEDSQGYVPVRESAYETDDYLEFLSDDTNIYSSTAKIVMKVNESADYINTPVFSGSSYLREQCGGAIATLFKADDNSQNLSTSDQLRTVISNAKSHF